jgi:hypothetical protein
MGLRGYTLVGRPSSHVFGQRDAERLRRSAGVRREPTE